MKKIFFSLLAFCALGKLIAQPQITTSITPVVGQSITYFEHDTLNIWPGPAGASQTWTYVLNSGTAGTINYISPAGTPYAAQFNMANTAVNENNTFQYYDEYSQSIDHHGFKNASDQLVYTDPEMLTFAPMNYQQLMQDICSGTFTIAGLNGTRTGTSDLFYDSYGTLIINGTTYTDVARLFHEENFYDSTASGVQLTHIENFRYYGENPMRLLLELRNTYPTGLPMIKRVRTFMSNTGIDKINSNNSLLIIPAEGHGNYRLLNLENDDYFLTVYDFSGRVLYTYKFNQTNPQINLSELSPGLYILKVIGQRTLFEKTGRIVHTN